MRISDWSSDVCSSDLLIVVHEIFGVHEWIRDMCRRFAKAGYYAIAPDLFARLGDASKERDIQALMTNFVPKTADAQVMSDIDHTVAFASGDGGDTDRLGVTGFCWGGRIRSEEHTSELQSLMRIS